MIKAFLFYIKSFVKGNYFFYFFCGLFAFLFYYETFGLVFNVSSTIEISGLWVDGGNDLAYYNKHIGIHYFVLSLLGLVLLVNITSSFFSSDYMTYILIKYKNRNMVVASYISTLAILILALFALHITFLNIFLYVLTSDLFFLPAFKTVLFIFPLSIFLATIVSSLSIILENKFSNLAAAFGYILVLPMVFEFFYINNFNIPFLPDFLITYNEYYIPFFLSYFGGIFKYSFGLDVFPIWQGYFITSFVFAALAVTFVKRRIY